MKKFLSVAILLALSSAANATQKSVFPDAVDPALTACTDLRLDKLVRKGASQSSDLTVGNYKYNTDGKIIQRAYLDSTFDYEYNIDGTLKKASALRAINREGIIIEHTKENFISDYTYENGKVTREVRQVFSSSASDLNGAPEVTYQINYFYDANDKLTRREQINQANNSKILYTYTFNDQDRLSKINEERKTGNQITDRDVLLLTYNDDGEIIKAVHKKPLMGNTTDEPPIIKTVDISYYASNDDVYPFYYVDPIKEWKVDRDFFGLSFHRIQKIVTTDPTKTISISYVYQDDNEDFLPDSFTATMAITFGDKQQTVVQQYSLEY
ncbi:hypothetical protein [Photobacterium damselae]|uniref:hypothetical protein n=1 Tax=Photobacterium damselae TaxID=38293 RepID=UPI000D9FEC23|nr:hypothetical protein [Photobacterium damselae]NVO73616.1 hypothetical protein [Photobacterium damselae subsp. damselae]UKA31780.1 hypothetical protein IPQ37_21155 [Photobacterium damselae subsp. damselae]SPY31293.1 Uncharacterised protein [Photobacterium damselae]